MSTLGDFTQLDRYVQRWELKEMIRSGRSFVCVDRDAMWFKARRGEYDYIWADYYNQPIREVTELEDKSGLDLIKL